MRVCVCVFGKGAHFGKIRLPRAKTSFFYTGTAGFAASVQPGMDAGTISEAHHII